MTQDWLDMLGNHEYQMLELAATPSIVDSDAHSERVQAELDQRT